MKPIKLDDATLFGRKLPKLSSQAHGKVTARHSHDDTSSSKK